MRDFFVELWTDQTKFRIASRVVVAFVLGVIVPALPLGDMGQIGYWIGKLSTPIALGIGAGDMTLARLKTADGPAEAIVKKIEKADAA